MTHLIRRLSAPAATLAALVLAGCGGGGDPSTSAAPVVNQDAGGIWQGQFSSNGVSVSGVMLITEDGRFFSEAENLNNGCADVTTGTVSTSGSTVTGNATVAIVSYSTSPGVTTNCTFSDGSTWGTGTLSGTVVQGSTLTLTAHDTTANGTEIPAATVTLAFDNLYDQSSTLSEVAGNWTLATGDTLSITSSGDMFAQLAASGCVINGQVSIINSSYNAYSASVTYSNCQGDSAILNGVTATGILSLNNQVSPSLLYAGYSATLPSGQVVITVGDATAN